MDDKQIDRYTDAAAKYAGWKKALSWCSLIAWTAITIIIILIIIAAIKAAITFGFAHG